MSEHITFYAERDTSAQPFFLCRSKNTHRNPNPLTSISNIQTSTINHSIPFLSCSSLSRYSQPATNWPLSAVLLLHPPSSVRDEHHHHHRVVVSDGWIEKPRREGEKSERSRVKERPEEGGDGDSRRRLRRSDGGDNDDGELLSNIFLILKMVVVVRHHCRRPLAGIGGGGGYYIQQVRCRVRLRVPVLRVKSRVWTTSVNAGQQESRAVNSSQRVGFGTNPVSHGRNQSTQSRLGQLSSVWSTRILGWFNSVKPSQTRLTTVNSKIRNALVAR
ncbi:uncharacterized protein LOC110890768 [Helianthus annuus]|uniref:uncharacterized protein LOC110890768 n=1 Tax=Helianthus annuus TaxID=4232 RepID=UPI001652EC8D|nr:uncharacterized protein LOC110890768 [Helianthus annuus]